MSRAASRPPPSRLPAVLARDAGLELRHADGVGRGRLAGLRDPPERVRPRPDRAGGVPAARPARAAGRTARRSAAADADRGVFQPRGGGRRRTPPVRDDPRRRSALAVRRARCADRRSKCDRRAGRPVADTRDRPDRVARRSSRDAIGGRSGGQRLRPGDRRPALRSATRTRIRRGRCPAGGRGRGHAHGEAARTRRSDRPTRTSDAREPAARRPLHPVVADHPRRDQPRPVRGAVRRRRRPAPAVRPLDPAHRTVRTGRAAERDCRRRARRRNHARTKAARRPRGPNAAACRRNLRREHDRVRALTLVPTLLRRTRGQRLRRHALDEHPLDDGGVGDPERRARACQRRRGRVHRRIERARGVRVRRRRRH